jgi:hypothetical protein
MASAITMSFPATRATYIEGSRQGRGVKAIACPALSTIQRETVLMPDACEPVPTST